MLTARQVLAEALSRALTDPFELRSLPASGRAQVEPLAEIWSGFQNLYADVKQRDLGLGELPPGRASIEPLMQWLSLDVVQRGEAWQRVFGLVVSKLCPPYETEYCHWKDATYRAQHLADIAGFYAAFKYEPDKRFAERQDHVALELLFLRLVHERWRFAIEHELGEQVIRVCAEAAGAFVRDHLAWWMPTFAKCLDRRIESLSSMEDGADGAVALRGLSGVARVLRAFTAIERLAHHLPPSREIIAPQVEAVPDDGTCHGCAGGAMTADTTSLFESVCDLSARE